MVLLGVNIVVQEEVAATIFSQSHEVNIKIEVIHAVIITEETTETIVETEAAIRRTQKDLMNISSQPIGIIP